MDYSALLPLVLPQVPNCSQLLAEQQIRRAAIVLCEESKILKHEEGPIGVTSGTSEYSFTPPTDTERVRTEWVTYDDRQLTPTTETSISIDNPRWTTTTGEPAYFMENNPGQIRLWPTPNATVASILKLRYSLRPTITSTSLSDTVMQDFRQPLVNGALSFLYLMPNQTWTNPDLGMALNQSFQVSILQAKQQARDGNVRSIRKVKYGGI